MPTARTRGSQGSAGGSAAIPSGSRVPGKAGAECREKLATLAWAASAIASRRAARPSRVAASAPRSSRFSCLPAQIRPNRNSTYLATNIANTAVTSANDATRSASPGPGPGPLPRPGSSARPGPARW